MSANVTQTANLYPYLVAEEAHRDHQAEEALFLTFNVTLGYLEARLLGVLRASGARVTVLADAGVWEPDVRAVNLAGIQYHVGLADQRTAFHPKLTVVVGPQRVLAAVGSGNLTIGGWQYNGELLTVFTGDREGVPAAVGDIRDVLNALLATVRTDSVTAGGIRRTVARLDVLLDGAPLVDTGHRVHASWVAPLVDHLPTEGVAELCLTAAFHDPDAHAVHALIDRMRPRQVRVTVQPGWTHVDAVALQAVLTDHAARTGARVELLSDPEVPGVNGGRYRHGKLIEWVTLNGERHAMTGSPNLTSVALLRRGGAGGNFELAVTGPAPESLFPAGSPVDAGIIPVLPGERDTKPADGAAAGVQVLSAVTKDDTLTVHLNESAAGEVWIEGAARKEHPDAWSTLGAVPIGARTVTFSVALPAGSRVRAATVGAGATAAMFVTGEGSVLARAIPTAQQSRLQRARADDLFGDDLVLLELLQADLAAFASEAAHARPPAATGDPAGKGRDSDRPHGSDAVQPWLWLQSETAGRYGPDIASWVLGLPKFADGDAEAVPWVDIITDDQVAGLDSDETVADVDETLTEVDTADGAADTIDHAGDAERVKRARRRWVTKAAAAAPRVSPLMRLAALRVALVLWSAGNWDPDDPEPFRLIRNLVRTLTTADQPAELVQRAASLAAIALTLMRERTDATVSTEQTLRFQEMRADARPLLSLASRDLIESYVAGLRTVSQGPLRLEHVTETLGDVAGDDPLAELEAAMVGKGFETHRPSGSSIHIHKPVGNPELSALEAVGFAQEHDGIVVWATTDQGRWACVAWKDPDLVTVLSVGPKERWRHQRLTDRRPAAVAGAVADAIRGSEGPARLPGLVNARAIGPTPEARTVLVDLGAPDPRRPPCCPQRFAP